MIIVPSVRGSKILVVGFDGIRALASVHIGSDERGDTRVDSLIDKIKIKGVWVGPSFGH
jgi:hypothetical protein